MNSNSYLQLLRANHAYRKLFTARTISLLGDWLNLIALFELLGHVTDSKAAAYGTVLIIKMLPLAVFAPIAGVVADRFNRKRIMIFADVARCICVLLFLFATSIDHPAFIYAILTLQMILSAFFDPAYRAFTPSVVSKEDLATANALGSMMWSLMLTLGAAIGGVVTELFGWEVVIFADALTYAISAWLIVSIDYTYLTTEPQIRMRDGYRTLKLDTAHLFRYLRQDKELFVLTSLKGLYSIGGAASLIHAIYGETVFPFGGSVALSISLFFMVRGLGTALGPIVARRFTQSGIPAMRRLILAGFVIAIAAYQCFAISEKYSVALFFVFLGHLGSSIVWVFSTTLMQLRANQRFLGRIFGLDLLLFTLIGAASTFVYSILLEHQLITVRYAASILGWSWSIGLLVWLWVLCTKNSNEYQSV